MGLVAVLALVLALFAARGHLERRRAAEERTADLATVDRVISDAHRRLTEARTEQQSQVVALRSLSEGLRRDLA